MKIINSKFNFSCFVIAVCVILISCNKSREIVPPNVVMIIADDLGWSQIGCYGSSFYKTPNIDKLAKSGIKFTNAYSAASICSPTRAAIMTGKYPARLDLTDFIPGNTPKNKPLLTPEDWQKYLPLKELTIAEKMESSGYSTGFYGKWHLSKEKLPPESLSHNPKMQGFNESFVTYKPSSNLIQQWQMENNDFHNVDTITKSGLEFLDQNQKSPFLLILSHNTIHDPLIESEKLIDKYANKIGSDKEENNPVIGAMIETLDKSVGEIINKLKILDLFDNTLLIFCSDNGGKHKHALQTPFKKGKGWLYEGGIRVPLIISWPKKIKKPFISNLMTSSIDFLPTILQVTNSNLDSKNEHDGIDISSIFSNQTKIINREELFWHYPHYHNGSGMKPASAIRWKNYKLIEWHEATLLNKDNQIELYDLTLDPGENNNLTSKIPDIAIQMRNKLRDWTNEVDAKMPQVNEFQIIAK
jgi:arylsulfatase A